LTILRKPTINAPSTIPLLAERLVTHLAALERVVVAFSGGVDSSVVAAAAYRALPQHSLAVTAISPSVASWQRKTATQIAAQIGIQHRWIDTDEVELPDYRRNDAQRCFHCKKTLYGSIQKTFETIRSISGDLHIVSGTNADDLGDYRPGLQAGADAGVQTPLADLGFNKAMVRQLAKHFGLANNDLPASPCLASRIAYGVEVTPLRLNRIDQCEAWLRQRGFDDVRVRLLNEDSKEVARVEVPLPDLQRLRQHTESMTIEFVANGFDLVRIDLKGLRSGNLNEALVELVGPLSGQTQPIEPRTDKTQQSETP
jgi:uncharacterized protein